jgi:hypothetical protein
MCDHGQLNYCEKCPPDIRRGVPSRWDYTPPSTQHLGETARQFQWLQDETAALRALSNGFSNIVDNARALDPDAPKPRKKKPEQQRMVFTNKGKKRKAKRRN